jgi:hypothetical protein
MTCRRAGAVVVVGGSGAVGRSVAEELTRRVDRDIVVTARDAHRADAVARSIGPTVRGAGLDLDAAGSLARVLDGAALVVMCVERANTTVAAECAARGISLVDVCATDAVLTGIRAQHDLAVARRCTVLLSVGLAPGLTNVLARRCHEQLPGASAIDLTLCFGLRGDAGPDSRRWILEGLSRRCATSGPVRVALPGFGRRRAFWFPFSDQHTMSSALGLPVSTRLCFESPLVTNAVFAGRGLGAFALLRRIGAGPALQRALGAVHVGTDRFLAHAEARDAVGGRAVAWVAGHGECRATGRITAAAVTRVLAGWTPAGVHHLDAVVDASGFLAEVGDGLVVREPVPAASQTCVASGVSRR